MKRVTIIFLTVLSINTFISCDNTKDDIEGGQNIQEKIQLLEKSQWLLEGFEDRVMYTFVAGKRYTHYGENTVFGEAIPETNDYKSVGELFFLDFNFGNTGTYELKFSCDSNIVELILDGNPESKSTLYKLGSNYQECLN